METINLKNRALFYKRHNRKGSVTDKRDRQGRYIQEVVLTPEGRISKHEKFALTMLRPKLRRADPDHWYSKKVDGEEMRARRARGHILAIWRLTGEDPNAVMTRIGLTSDEIARIARFRKTVTWE